MTVVQSYLRFEAGFVPVENWQESIPNPQYIEGAIEISIDSRMILSTDMWDYVDQLWAYLIGGLETVYANGEFSTYFPDQPIKLTLRPINGRRKIVVQVDAGVSNSVTVPFADFAMTLLKSAEVFFTKLLAYAPQNRRNYNDLLARIKRLKQSISGAAQLEN